jgi:hypothetical protein
MLIAPMRKPGGCEVSVDIYRIPMTSKTQMTQTRTINALKSPGTPAGADV